MSQIVTFTGPVAQKQCSCQSEFVCSQVTQIEAQIQLYAHINKTQLLQRYEIRLPSPEERAQAL